MDLKVALHECKFVFKRKSTSTFFQETSPFRKCISSESKKVNLTKYPERVHHSSITISLNNALPGKLNNRPSEYKLYQK